MKKLLFLLGFAALLVSCGENKTEVVEAPVTEATKPVVQYPYEAELATDWTIGDPEKTVKVLELYRHLQKDDFADSVVMPYFADSITSVSFDERVYTGSPKEFLDNVRKFRSQFKELDEEFVSFVCLHSESKDIDMVSLWFKENAVRTNGKSESTRYQENWIFNKDGKITHRTAFARYGF